MPFYNDPQFNVRTQHSIVGNANAGVSASTATASGSQTISGVYKLRAFIRPTVVSNVRVYVTGTAPSNFNSLTAVFLNGTNTFASGVVGTGTSNQFIDLTMTSANSTFTASGQPTVNLVGTSTASGQALGTFAIEFETTELFN